MKMINGELIRYFGDRIYKTYGLHFECEGKEKAFPEVLMQFGWKAVLEVVDRKQFFLSYVKFHLPFGYPRKNVSWYDFWNSELSAMSSQYRSL